MYIECICQTHNTYGVYSRIEQNKHIKTANYIERWLKLGDFFILCVSIVGLFSSLHRICNVVDYIMFARIDFAIMCICTRCIIMYLCKWSAVHVWVPLVKAKHKISKRAKKKYYCLAAFHSRNPNTFSQEHRRAVRWKRRRPFSRSYVSFIYLYIMAFLLLMLPLCFHNSMWTKTTEIFIRAKRRNMLHT